MRFPNGSAGLQSYCVPKGFTPLGRHTPAHGGNKAAKLKAIREALRSTPTVKAALL